MKKTFAFIALLLLMSCFTLSAADSDPTMRKGDGFSNNKKTDKEVAKQLKKINKALQVKTNFKKDGINSVEWLNNTQCSIKREIEYTDACGTISTAIELLFISKATTVTDSTEPAITYLMHQKSMELQKIALYQPRCENGSITPNSYNLIWFNNKGQLTELP